MVLLLLLGGMIMTAGRKRDIEIPPSLAMTMTSMGGNRLHGIVVVHLLQTTEVYHQNTEVLVKEAHIQMTDLLMKGGGGQMIRVQDLEMIDLHLEEIEVQRDTLMTGIHHPGVWMTEYQQGH